MYRRDSNFVSGSRFGAHHSSEGVLLFRPTSCTVDVIGAGRRAEIYLELIWRAFSDIACSSKINFIRADIGDRRTVTTLPICLGIGQREITIKATVVRAVIEYKSNSAPFISRLQFDRKHRSKSGSKQSTLVPVSVFSGTTNQEPPEAYSEMPNLNLSSTISVCPLAAS